MSGRNSPPERPRASPKLTPSDGSDSQSGSSDEVPGTSKHRSSSSAEALHNASADLPAPVQLSESDIEEFFSQPGREAYFEALKMLKACETQSDEVPTSEMLEDCKYRLTQLSRMLATPEFRPYGQLAVNLRHELTEKDRELHDTPLFAKVFAPQYTPTAASSGTESNEKKPGTNDCRFL